MADPDSPRERLQRSLGTAYTLEHELGGGMSRVFVAVETRLQRRVVVKWLAPELAASLSAVRFEREVMLAARLQAPHIVPVLSAGEADGLPYYTMPYVDGESLHTRLAAGPLPLDLAVGILRDIATALAYAHAHGVVHRDVKPANVLLSGRTAVVTDFGIAKAVQAARTAAPGAGSARASPDAGSPATLTRTGMVVGTPAYLAPEQAAGDAAVDHRADLYAWGVVAYEVLAGRHPFADRTAPHQLIMAHLVEAPPPLGAAARERAIPRALADLVMRALAKDPALRPPSADAIVAALDRPALPGAADEPRAGGAPPGRRRAHYVGGLAAVALLAGAAAAVIGRRPPQAAREARVGAGLRSVARVAPASVAVLPLLNVGGDTADAYFVDGLTDEVTGTLGRVPGLRVAARSAVGAVAPQPGQDARAVGRHLGVATVLTGRVRRQGRTLRLSIELVDVADGAQRWSASYARDVRDAFRVQDEVARAIATALRVTLAGGARPAGSGTSSPEAHDLVLRGRYQAARYTEPALRRAVAFAERAVALDSNYAGAWSLLAEAWSSLADDFVPARDALIHIRPAVARALALDSASADVQNQRASLAFWYDRDVATADRAFVRALALDSASEAAVWYAYLLAVVGRRDSGLAVLRRFERLEPTSRLLAERGVLAYEYLGSPADARGACARALEIDPDAYAGCREVLLPPTVRWAAVLDACGVADHWCRAIASVHLARRAEARREAAVAEVATAERKRRGGFVDPVYEAILHAQLADAVPGARERALSLIDSGFGVNSALLAVLRVDPRLAALRGDARFAALVRRAGRP